MHGRSAAKILMVDDRPENLLALEAILQGLGHDLIKAGSGEDALKCLLTHDVAVILLDVQMPGMDGFETASHVKRRERTREIPILFLTAIDGEAHQAFRGYAAGGVDYLAKPFDPWVLKAKVGVFVDLYERRRQLVAEADELRRQLARYVDAGLDGLSGQACDAIERAQWLLRHDGPGLLPALGAALDDAATAAGELQRVLKAPVAAGRGR